jgi:hypothetical protein
MKPVWPYLGDRAPDSRRDSDIAKNAENRENRGNRGNKPRNIGGSRIPAPGNCSGTQKCRANSFVPAVPLVPAENDVPGDNRDRWNQRIPRTAHPPAPGVGGTLHPLPGLHPVRAAAFGHRFLVPGGSGVSRCVPLGDLHGV